jgi:uncharacterized protein YlxW (UPF0749 family)
MFTPSSIARLLSVLVIPGFLAMSVLGCVSSSTYEAAKKEAQDLQHQLQQERLKREAIAVTFGDEMKQMQNLVTQLSSSVEQYNGIANNWNDLRDELVALRVNRELERQKGACGMGIVMESRGPSTTPTK